MMGCQVYKAQSILFSHQLKRLGHCGSRFIHSFVLAPQKWWLHEDTVQCNFGGIFGALYPPAP